MEVTAYLCARTHKVQAVEVTAEAGQASAAPRLVNGVLEIWLMPAAMPVAGPAPTVVTAKLLREGRSIYEPKEFKWGWQLTGREGDASRRLVGYPRVEFETPQMCQYSAFELHAQGPGGEIPVILELPAPVVGAAPDDKAAAAPYAGQKLERTVTSGAVVPGAMLNLYWVLQDESGGERLEPAASAPWCTRCFTGGRVAAVSGEATDPAATYAVEVLVVNEDVAVHRVVTCTRSDFTAWAVGDWVFLHAPSQQCADLSTDEGYQAAKPEPGGEKQYVILPMEVAGVRGSASYEAVLYSYTAQELVRLHQTRIHEAMIIDVRQGEDKADVEISGVGRRDAVPVHYHCPSCETVSGGAKGFKPDDLVYVLNPGGDASFSPGNLRVVGRVEGPRPCSQGAVFAILFEKPTALHELGITGGFHDEVWTGFCDGAREGPVEVLIVDQGQAAPMLTWSDFFEVRYLRIDEAGQGSWLSREAVEATHDPRASWDVVRWRRPVSLWDRAGSQWLGHYLLGQRWVCPQQQMTFKLPGGPSITLAATFAGCAVWVAGGDSAWRALTVGGVRQAIVDDTDPPAVTDFMEYDAPSWWIESIGLGQKPRIRLDHYPDAPSVAGVVGPWLVNGDDPNYGKYVYHEPTIRTTIYLGELSTIDAIQAGLYVWPYSLLQGYDLRDYSSIPWPMDDRCICVVERMLSPDDLYSGLYPGKRFIMAVGKTRAYVDDWLLSKVAQDPTLHPKFCVTLYDGPMNYDEGPFGGKKIAETTYFPRSWDIEWSDVAGDQNVASSPQEIMRGPSAFIDGCDIRGMFGDGWDMAAATRQGGGWSVWYWGSWSEGPIMPPETEEYEYTYVNNCPEILNDMTWGLFQVEFSPDGRIESTALSEYDGESIESVLAGREVVMRVSGRQSPWCAPGTTYTEIKPDGSPSYCSFAYYAHADCSQDIPSLAEFESIIFFGSLGHDVAATVAAAIPAGGRVVGASQLVPK